MIVHGSHVGAEPQQWQPPTMKTCPTCHQAMTYTVKPGDTLAKIAAALYPNGGATWRTIWGANVAAIKNPNVIVVGQKLRLPV